MEPFHRIRGLTVPPRNTSGRREGYTTGTSAAAATKAACMILLNQEPPESVSIQLPIPRTLEIKINTLKYDGATGTAGVVKDAGDDPDVTHGAEILPPFALFRNRAFILKAASASARSPNVG